MNESVKHQSVHNVITQLREMEIAHLTIQNQKIVDNKIRYDNKELINFGSCSYLGLEISDDLKKGAIDAIHSFGTQYSSSRAYSSLPLYNQLEGLLVQIFKAPLVIFPSTTLAHQGTLPVLIGKDDAVILDHQVHTSVQSAAQIVKAGGTHTELVRHNRMDLLEKRIIELSRTKKNVWYLADGIYSMYGDTIPMDEIDRLLNKYPQFNVYVDDAHGMSCYGERGEGYVLAQKEQHERLILATSFAKAFATGGGVIVCKNQEVIERIKNCASTFITSGPLQPATLGAACASAKIHLSDQFALIQNELKERIQFVNFLLDQQELPNFSEGHSPIFFVGTGLPKVAMDVIKNMKDRGFALNIGVFPAVPMKNAGIRFTINRLHSFEELKEMVEQLAVQYYGALQQEGLSLDKVFKFFKKENPFQKRANEQFNALLNPDLIVQKNQSILDVQPNEWNSHLGQKGMLSWNNLNVLEHSFDRENEIENNWSFEYLTIKNKEGGIVLQTFASSGIMKDDLLAEKEVSATVEQWRENDKYANTSTFVALGTLVTEGSHIFYNESSPELKNALKIMFEWLDELKTKFQASSILLRDFDEKQQLLNNMMFDHGYFKQNMPKNYSVNVKNWDVRESYKTMLSKRSKRHFKENVEKSFENFDVIIQKAPSIKEIKTYYDLYKNVHQTNVGINTYALPYKFIENLCLNDEWECVVLNKKGTNHTVAVVFLHLGVSDSSAALVGIDYSLSRETNAYRQVIYQVILRSKQLGYDEIKFGYSAGVEKKKFGAIESDSVVYMQIEDTLKFEELDYSTDNHIVNTVE